MPPKKQKATQKKASSDDQPAAKAVKTSSAGAASSSSSAAPSSDPLGLKELFSNADEWLQVLRPKIEALRDAHEFIGPNRSESVVPVRELTFQALKPNTPERWKVVIFGQNPYPRIESATGIAMFDNSFKEWADSKFGRVTSIRCIIKAAAMWKYKVEKQTSVKDLRGLLSSNNIVQPPEWFQAMLTQGCLLLNAALTASSDSSVSTSKHATFWRPVVVAIVEEILRAKSEAGNGGVVFAWWGSHAKALKKIISKLESKYSVPVKHIDYCNPAAMGDAFCNSDHFKSINDLLSQLGEDTIDWLPSTGWQQTAKFAKHGSVSERMGNFITETMDLHKMYLERIQGVKDETGDAMEAIVGVLDLPLVSFGDAMAPVLKLHPSLKMAVGNAINYASQRLSNLPADSKLTVAEIAAVHLYTMGSSFYRDLNATMRTHNKARIKPYFQYLRLFFSALEKLSAYNQSLWRGVGLDLKSQYPKGKAVAWWGVSSCTIKRSVAESFMGFGGKRTLFEIKPRRAVSIMEFSAFTGEAEYILAPGTLLQVENVTTSSNGLCIIQLSETDDERLIR